MSNQIKSGNSDYENLIQEKFAAALESNDSIKEFKKINFKLNLCISLFVLKLILDIQGTFHFFKLC